MRYFQTVPAAVALVLLLPLGVCAAWPASELRMHEEVRAGNVHAADSIARADAEAFFAHPRRYPHGYRHTVMSLIAGRFDSLLADAERGRVVVGMGKGSDADFGVLVEFNQTRILEEIQARYGGSEAGEMLRLLQKSLILSAKAGLEEISIIRFFAALDSGQLMSYAIRPSQADVNALVLRHLDLHGDARFGKELTEVLFFLTKRDPFPFGFAAGPGRFWMKEKGQTSPDYYNPSWLIDYRFSLGYMMLKAGRTSFALDACYLVHASDRFVLAPYLGVGRYSFKEDLRDRSIWGPDAGVNLDWNFHIWQVPRGRFNAFMRLNFGAQADPQAIREEGLAGTLTYANLGLGINLDIFAKFTPYLKNGRVKYLRDRNWW